jgi:orotate phosphoribosyltransferase
MHYRSISDLNDDIVNWITKLPRDLDLIVGIPRSGLLVANLLAVHLNLPLTDLDGLLEKRVLAGGGRLNRPVSLPSPDRLKILVVDDIVWTGSQLERAKERIALAGLPHDIQYGVVYLHPYSKAVVDHFHEVLPGNRLFEWALLHNQFLTDACMDIDGVLCRDTTAAEDDDGENYRRFLSTVEPEYHPSWPVGWLVTSRLEKYRELTEKWLARHEIPYQQLVMLDLPTAEERRRTNAGARFKAEVYKRTGAKVFFESSVTEAVEIARLSGRPVYAVDTRQMVFPGVDPGGRRQSPLLRNRIAWVGHEIRRKGWRGTLSAVERRVKARLPRATPRT